ncbi:alpha/beta hydrolase [Nocardioides marmoriginsengisoli]|uniref:Alpha/beta hydrolase n=1 Tax=Nocardioides marmoriginsengisoli TaxID=661483 RepID=A0A3N0CFZ7_9ACTN|nr:alpha/beta hydrolase [Nocardioides marmoriginsengisoli]RNL61936.1 alpha/beta hydrolase [Nocardioides marmoriginsengisoli]
MRMLENGSHFVDVGGYQLHCAVIGSGPPLLVVHGGMGYGHGGFRPWLDALGDSRTVIYVDLPGNGKSGTPADYEQWSTVDRLSDSLHQLRVGLGLETWSVFGHSFGGYVVQSYALDHPDEIDSLVISCSTSIMDHMDESLRFARIASHSDEQYEAIAGALFTPMTSDAEFDRVTSQVRSAYFADPDFLGRDVQMPSGGSAAAFNATLRVWDNSDLSNRVASITVPTLVLGAARDWTFPLDVGARRTHRLIEGSSYHEFADSGHFPYVEEHDEFIEVVAGWLLTP